MSPNNQPSPGGDKLDEAGLPQLGGSSIPNQAAGAMRESFGKAGRGKIEGTFAGMGLERNPSDWLADQGISSRMPPAHQPSIGGGSQVKEDPEPPSPLRES